MTSEWNEMPLAYDGTAFVGIQWVHASNMEDAWVGKMWQETVLRHVWFYCCPIVVLSTSHAASLQASL